MPQPSDLDPYASDAAFFGAELRRLRMSAQLTQGQLGKLINYTGAYVGLIENAKRTPPRDLAERADAALGTDGVLARLWPQACRDAFPEWFRDYVDLEASATSILTYQTHVFHGLLQTEEYARALFATVKPEDLEERVEARMARQAVLSSGRPPLLWMILEESVLHRPIGSRDVQRAQLAHLLEAAEASHIYLQMLPLSAGGHAGISGSFTLMSFSEGPDIAYQEGYGCARLTAFPIDLARYSLAYDQLQAAALAHDVSTARIAAVMEEL